MIQSKLYSYVHLPIDLHIVPYPPLYTIVYWISAIEVFEDANIVDETSCTNQYTTPHPHHSNNTKQHIYPNAHQWRQPISLQQSIGLDD